VVTWTSSTAAKGLKSHTCILYRRGTGAAVRRTTRVPETQIVKQLVGMRHSVKRVLSPHRDQGIRIGDGGVAPLGGVIDSSNIGVESSD